MQGEATMLSCCYWSEEWPIASSALSHSLLACCLPIPHLAPAELAAWGQARIFTLCTFLDRKAFQLIFQAGHKVTVVCRLT